MVDSRSMQTDRSPSMEDSARVSEELQTAAPLPAPLNAEWQAYRDSLVSYARGGAVALPPNDSRNAVPVSLRPGKHSVHHSYIWLGGLSALGAIAVAVVISSLGSIISLIEGGLSSIVALLIAAGVGIVMALVIGGIVFSVQWLSWKNLSYELTPTEFSLFSGIINKKRRHVPYQRIQSVNQQAGVMQRVLGICNVKIDTAGGAANDAVLLRYVRTSEAEALRSELFRRKNSCWQAVRSMSSALRSSATRLFLRHGSSRVPAGTSVRLELPSEPIPRCLTGLSTVRLRRKRLRPATEGNLLDGADELLSDMRGVFGGQEVATGSVSYEAGLSNKELFFAGLSGAAGHFGVIIAGIIGLAGAVAQFFESNIEEWVESSVDGMMAGASSSMQGVDMLGGLFGSFAWQVALWAIVSVLALWAFSVVGQIVQYGGFKARRRESRIEVEHGLLQRTFHGIDVDRVQTVIVKQSFVRRLIGYCELSVGKIDSASQDSQEGQMSVRGMVIHPFVKVDRVPEIIAGVLPEFADIPQETVKPAPVALRRAIVRKTVIRSSVFWLMVGVHLGAARLRGRLAVGRFFGRCRRIRDDRNRFRGGRFALYHRRRAERGRRGAVVSLVGARVRPFVHERHQRRLVAKDRGASTQEDPVWVHEDQSVPAGGACSHCECPNGRRRRRHHRAVVGRIRRRGRTLDGDGCARVGRPACTKMPRAPHKARSIEAHRETYRMSVARFMFQRLLSGRKTPHRGLA